MPTSFWVLIVVLGVAKIPLAALLLWYPFRSDEAMSAVEQQQGSSEDEGGSKVDRDGGRPHPPRSPRRGPRSPRRGGPHGSPAPLAPARVRLGTRTCRPQRLRLR